MLYYGKKHRTNLVENYTLTFCKQRVIIIKLSDENTTNGKTAGAARELRDWKTVEEISQHLEVKRKKLFKKA